MQYRINKKTNDEISLLGFGCMRFKRKADGTVDVEETRRQIRYAVENGVNYIDTAYVYPDSEKVTGRILFEEKLRNKVFLATKLPRWSVKTENDMCRFFAEQKENLRTDYFDYYLLHNFNEYGDWQNLQNKGALDFITRKKQSGEIRRIGFSYHGGFDEFKKILDSYDWDFTQLQVNYFDEFNQAGKRGVEYAEQKGVSVIIMEPLRGGQLAGKLPQAAEEKFAALNKLSGKNLTVAEWALKWVWSMPNALTALSGMNTMEQVEENIVSADRFEPLTEQENDAIKEIQTLLLSMIKVPCTECGYCAGCPQDIDIPGCFSLLNALHLLNAEQAKSNYDRFVRSSGCIPETCIECGICETKCPQRIQIRDWLKQVATDFGVK